jgi:hypothetical protein
LKPAAPTAGGAEAADSPGSSRLRCPHCQNPVQLADADADEILCPGCGGTFRAREARATMSRVPMRPLGKFQLLERVGTGALGAVWKARDTTLDRVVALKVPHTGLLTADEDLERFLREARAAAQLCQAAGGRGGRATRPRTRRISNGRRAGSVGSSRRPLAGRVPHPGRQELARLDSLIYLLAPGRGYAAGSGATLGPVPRHRRPRPAR